MRYYALACDYDGTMADRGRVSAATMESLQRLKRSGRRLLIVTGRELDDLKRVFSGFEIADRIIAENGGVLYDPATRKSRDLAAAPGADLVKELHRRKVEPISAGHVIVSTREPHQTEAIDAIRALGLELKVVFNKGAVMILPSGTSKATGLLAALDELGLSPRNTVAIGDAENDHAMLEACECAVAVSDALPAVRDRADWVTPSGAGEGVRELIHRLVSTDLADLDLPRRRIPLGADVELSPYPPSLLVAGISGSGKSTLATGLLERIAARGYQVCVIDPEGDYENFEAALQHGDAQREPSIDAIVRALEQPRNHVVANLLAIPAEKRPDFFERLLPGLLELRSRTGRPHWILIDEAHHMLPVSSTKLVPPRELHSTILVTVHPDHVSPAVLSSLHGIVAVGAKTAEILQSFSRAVGEPPPEGPIPELKKAEAVVWWRRPGPSGPRRFAVLPPEAKRKRHIRKYAEGDLGDHSFYFRGPDDKLNLRAQNLTMFLQLADGVDDDTWTFHLDRGDYTTWFRDAIKDDDLAEEAKRIERNALAPRESRARIRTSIESRYSAPV